MKKTYIIPEILIADLSSEQFLALSYTNTSANKGNATYSVDGVEQEYDSDGY